LREDFIGTGISFSFPIRFNYFGINYTQADDQSTNGPPLGPTIQIFFEDSSGLIP
jgi:hypothetical protein